MLILTVTTCIALLGYSTLLFEAATLFALSKRQPGDASWASDHRLNSRATQQATCIPGSQSPSSYL